MSCRVITLTGPRWHRVPPPLTTGLLLVDDDAIALRADGHWLEARRGDVVLLRGGVETTVRLGGSGSVQALLLARGPRRETRRVPRREVARRARAEDLVALLRRSASADEVTTLLAAALVHALGPVASACNDPVVQRAIDLVLSRLDQRLTLEELSRAGGVSRAALARRFRAALGVAPERYLTQLRLAEAAARLLHTGDSMAGIAAAVGYQSEFAFSRAFKRLYGVAPGRYRRRWSRPREDEPRLAA